MLNCNDDKHDTSQTKNGKIVVEITFAEFKCSSWGHILGGPILLEVILSACLFGLAEVVL